MMKKQKNILKNQFIKFIVLIIIFNFLNKKNNDMKYIGVLLSILFILLHNSLIINNLII